MRRPKCAADASNWVQTRCLINLRSLTRFLNTAVCWVSKLGWVEVRGMQGVLQQHPESHGVKLRSCGARGLAHGALLLCAGYSSNSAKYCPMPKPSQPLGWMGITRRDEVRCDLLQRIHPPPPAPKPSPHAYPGSAAACACRSPLCPCSTGWRGARRPSR